MLNKRSLEPFCVWILFQNASSHSVLDFKKKWVCYVYMWATECFLHVSHFSKSVSLFRWLLFVQEFIVREADCSLLLVHCMFVCFCLYFVQSCRMLQFICFHLCVCYEFNVHVFCGTRNPWLDFTVKCMHSCERVKLYLFLLVSAWNQPVTTAMMLRADENRITSLCWGKKKRRKRLKE